MDYKKRFPLLTLLCLSNILATEEVAQESNEQITLPIEEEVCGLSSNIMATEEVAQESNEQITAPIEEGFCGLSRSPFRIEARHIESKGIGYKEGYSSLTGFFTVPHMIEGSWMPFLDLRGHVFNDGKLAANAGAGVRYLTDWAWGLNIYYDYRKTHRQHYNQVSVGVEALGELLDFRINGYLPVGRKTSKFYDTRFKKFKGNNMILSRKQEFAMKGANGEIGFHIYEFKNVSLYAATGPYYFEQQGKTAWGGEARFNLEAFDYLRIQANASYDNIFKGIVQGEIGVIIPFGGKKNIKKRNGYNCHQEMIVKERALQRVDRQEIIVVDRKRHEEKAIDPATGLPYVFWFVNNTSHSNGTIESPFNTLLDAQNASSQNDVIYVFPGDGTTTGMDAGITLLQGQQLLGAGIPQFVNTTVGMVKIPAQASGLPSIITTTPNVGSINLTSSNNVISGLNLPDPGTGTTNNIYISDGGNYKIINNVMSISNDATCINDVSVGTSPSNYALIANNTFIALDGTNTNGYLTFSSLLTNIVIENNVFTAIDLNSGLGIGAGVFLLAPVCSVSITNNSFSSYNTKGSGFEVIQANQKATIDIIGNAINIPASDESGVFIQSGGNMVVNLQQNTVIGPVSSGCYDFINPLGTLVINMQQNSATIESTAETGYFVENLPGATTVVNMLSNTVSGSGTMGGYYLNNLDPNPNALQATIRNSNGAFEIPSPASITFP